MHAAGSVKLYVGPEVFARGIDALLDVTSPEPLPAGQPLFTLPNVWITPHLAGVQGTEARRLGAYAVTEVEHLLAGRPMSGEIHADQLPSSPNPPGPPRPHLAQLLKTCGVGGGLWPRLFKSCGRWGGGGGGGGVAG
ncbi:NAD(P)-dependent oxidoreductase [Catellatospora methionotrophica]|uniref:NAD(P)-dependent oxidoreductase n=1 Tax=Catellatospora methionotrophica TaxID=121620 RepID=UPI003908A4CA